MFFVSRSCWLPNVLKVISPAYWSRDKKEKRYPVLWKSNSIFNLWVYLKFYFSERAILVMIRQVPPPVR
jgi:hypothetical protein